MNNYAIRYASKNGHSKVVNLLLNQLLNNHQVNPVEYFHDAIKMASKNGHSKVVKLLIRWYLKNKRKNEIPKLDELITKALNEVYNENVSIALTLKHFKVCKDVIMIILSLI
jgi:ankyrin repeat protein